jgi:hypothetical protein
MDRLTSRNTLINRGRVYGVIVMAITVCSLLFASAAGAIVAGAGFTTFDSTVEGCLNGNNPNGVNCNLYEGKDKVYMSGGPETLKSGLSDGSYYFAVLTPGEQNGGFVEGAKGNLSDQTAGGTTGDLGHGDEQSKRTFEVLDHQIQIASYTGGHAKGVSPKGRDIIGLAPFDDTDNPGGVYILAICQVGATSPSQCKYDAFKVKREGEEEEEEVEPFGTISGLKYYDVNHNGGFDAGEAPLPNWAIDWTDTVSGTELTNSSGLFEVKNLVEDTYTFTEEQGPAGWIQTGNVKDESIATFGSTVTLEADKSYKVELAESGIVSGINFGNVCEIQNSNGLTLGFWSNKNGEKILNANDQKWRALLNGSYLRKANGALYTIPLQPAKFADVYKEFRTWILAATATNMSYMLSAQLAATQLDIAYNKLDGTNLVNDPDGDGWVTINHVVADAIEFLKTHPNTTAAGADRTLAEAYKNIFDSLNNNIQAITPADPKYCPAYTFIVL